jgi:hypothetical protein
MDRLLVGVCNGEAGIGCASQRDDTTNIARLNRTPRARNEKPTHKRAGQRGCVDDLLKPADITLRYGDKTQAGWFVRDADRWNGSALACDVDTPANASFSIDELSAVVGLHPRPEPKFPDSFDSTGFSWIVHGGCSGYAKGESGKISESRRDPTALNEPNTISKSLGRANTAEQPLKGDMNEGLKSPSFSGIRGLVC